MGSTVGSDAYDVLVSTEAVDLVRVRLSDPTVVAYFVDAEKAGADLPGLVEQLVLVGVRAAQVSGATTETAALAVAIEQAHRSINETSTEAARRIGDLVEGVTAPDGQIVTSIDSMLVAFSERIGTLVSGEDAPLRSAINRTMADARAELSRSLTERLHEHRAQVALLLDPSSPESPLRSVTDELRRLDSALAEIRATMERSQGRQEIAQHSTAKGAPYEEYAVAVLQHVSSGLGHVCEATGAKTGRSRKSGDAVVEIELGDGPCARIVMEAKTARMDSAAWRREASKALPNREAHAFLGMAANDDAMPTPGMRVWVDEPHLIVLRHGEDDDPDLLTAVVRLLQLEAMSRAAASGGADLTAVRTAIVAAVRELERFGTLQRQLASARNAVDSAQRVADELKDELERRLREASTSLGSSPAASPSEH